MTSPYIARSPGSLYGSVGAPRSPVQPLDVGGALDALTNAGTSYIHQALLRRQAENQMAVEGARVGAEKQRLAQEQTNWETQRADEQEKERHRFIEAGGIPASTTVGTQDTTVPLSPGAQTAVSRALQPAPAKPDASGLPPVEVTPSGGPPTMPTTIQSSEPVARTTPEGYDPTRGAAFVRGQMVGQLRNEGWIQRDEYNNDARLARMQEHDKHVAAMRAGTERPIMVGGNPYYKNAEGNLAPALGDDGKPLDLTKVPQKPQTANEKDTAGSRDEHELDVQIGQAQKDRTDAEIAQSEFEKRYRAATPIQQTVMHVQAQQLKDALGRAQAKVRTLTAQKDSARAGMSGRRLGVAPAATTAPTTTTATPSGGTAPSGDTATSTTLKAAPAAPAKPPAVQDWQRANPRKKGENDSTYYKRYLKDVNPGR